MLSIPALEPALLASATFWPIHRRTPVAHFAIFHGPDSTGLRLPLYRHPPRTLSRRARGGLTGPANPQTSRRGIGIGQKRYAPDRTAKCSHAKL